MLIVGSRLLSPRKADRWTSIHQGIAKEQAKEAGSDLETGTQKLAVRSSDKAVLDGSRRIGTVHPRNSKTRSLSGEDFLLKLDWKIWACAGRVSNLTRPRGESNWNGTSI